MLLKYVESLIADNPDTNFSQFIRFKKDVDEDQRNQLKRAALPQAPFEEIIESEIPTDTTINAQVVFTINGDATVGYPFLNKDCTPVLASQVRTRRLYPVRVNTGISTGAFKYIGDCPLPRTGTVPATGLPITTATTVQAQAVKVGGK